MNLRKTGDNFSVGIARGVFELAREFAQHFVSENVLNFIGIIVHVFRSVVGWVGLL